MLLLTGLFGGGVSSAAAALADELFGGCVTSVADLAAGLFGSGVLSAAVLAAGLFGSNVSSDPDTVGRYWYPYREYLRYIHIR